MVRETIPATLRGRDKQWARLAGVLARAGTGGPPVVVVEGATGSGRTRVLTELAAAVERDGGLVFEHRGALPARLVRHLVADRAALAGHLAAGGGDQGPVVVLWDDPLWTDPELIPALLAAGSDGPVVWVVTRRTGPGRPSTPDSADVAVVELGPLDRTAVAELLADRLGAVPAPELLDLAGAAGGNPGRLVDLVDGLRADDLVTRGPTAQLSTRRLPAVTRHWVHRQLATMSDRARHLVQVAAILGPASALSDLTGPLRDTVVGLLPELEEALASGLLVPAGHRVAFSHDLVRTAVTAGLATPVRAALAAELLGPTGPAGADQSTTVDSTGGTTADPADAPRSPLIPRQPTRDSVDARDAATSREAGPAGDATDTRSAGPNRGRFTPPRSGWESLSEIERRIAALITHEGLTNRQLGPRVFLSEHGVNYHLRNMYRKLGISSRVQLATLAGQHLRRFDDPA